MAQFKNMYKVELNNGIAPVVSLKQIYYADVEANRIGAIVTMNGQLFPLSGTCTGSAILADGSTVPMTGVIDGNQAYIDLDSSCYSVEGQIKIFVKITTGGVTTTLLAAVGTVQLTETDTVIDPGTIIPSVSALITAIEDAVESIPADYTALLETIAPMYANLTFPVKAGQWCWYSGVLYEANQDISTSENWTAAHWGTTTVGASLSELKSAVNGKADIDGYYEGMTVGDAEQLVATVGVQDKVPYYFRTSGGSIEIGDREVDKIVGGTVAWNQLVGENTEAVTPTSGHMYAACIGGVWGIGTSDGTAISVTGGTDQLFDLTLMFGQTIANYINTLETATPGAGVAWFRALFPKDYYAYDAGTLRSVQVSAHKMVGFNAYDNETGKALVIGGSEYEITGTYTALSLDGETVTPVSGKFTPAKSGELTVTGGDGTTCIHLRWDGERDGEFEPYTVHTYPLDSSLELRGIPKLDANNRLYYDGDEYESNGTVTRKYAIVDLGTLNWKSQSISTQKSYYSDRIPAKIVADNGCKSICQRYTKSNFASGFVADAGNMKYMISIGQRININDNSYDDVDTFKAAMSGVYLVYELDTPTTETAAPYQNPQIVDDFGTEQYIDAGDRDVEIPVGHDTFYRQNLRAKLETAPNSPESNGDYLMRRNNGQNSYVPYASPLPALPAEDGTYTLKCTVSGGTAALSWEAET